ncbi:MAG: polysaccharide deacetylase family protein [Elusimicrobia bacterium]|nr:polysaccharide deacetylase family protein [Candidatus Obscuribacterium magneticum]
MTNSTQRLACLPLLTFIFLLHPLVLSMPSVTPIVPAKRIALTFDDGPRTLPTNRLRRVLAEHGVRATFFIVGKVAARHPQLIRSLAADGHEVANHTWTHTDIRHFKPGQLRWELDRTRRLIRRLTGRDTRLFRTPGSSESFLRKWFKVPAGYRLVLWDVHSLDNEQLSPDTIVQRIVSSLKDGEIILMHNGLPNSFEALERLLPLLQEQGFQFVTVSDLLDKEPVRADRSLRHVITSG